MRLSNVILFFVALTVLALSLSCNKNTTAVPQAPNPSGSSTFSFNSLTVNGLYNGFVYKNINPQPVIKVSFSEAIDQSTIDDNIKFNAADGGVVNYTKTFEDNNKTIILTPAQPLQYLTKYNVSISTGLRSAVKTGLQTAVNVELVTGINPDDKFTGTLTDDQLLDLVQRQTFKYFWDFGHPASGLARERNTSGDVVTSGGSGFGIMSIIVAVDRQFISRADGLERMKKIVGFLKNNAQKFHGAFPHWLNGATGEVVPFSPQDNGADLVETSFLMQGLLTARQYFDQASTDETTLRDDINLLYNNVEWDWFRQNSQNVLYWHWSPNLGFAMNMKIEGWNEALITYVLAAASSTHGIPKAVYDEGWARNGAIKNGANYYGVQLPLGPVFGGPLFFSHYFFLGINPKGLTDAYADYEAQTLAHTLINYNYCVDNPKNYMGYAANCWGLTASDIKGGYTASSPANDAGFIAPTAAISSFPYTPKQSMEALRFFYYKLGDKLWGEYGFYDAFSLEDPWFSGSYLAIDQGPQIVMIENYRSGLLWRLFMSCPEIKSGLKALGFSSPNL